AKMLDHAERIRAVDRGALICGPEEWGWSGYLYSGYDQQWGAAHNWSSFPDRAAHGGADYVPWLVSQMRGLLDIVTLHYYPQAGSPPYDAIRIYRKNDGAKSAFGDTSASAGGPNPDDVAVFAAQRSSDGALTVMIVTKVLSGTTPATVRIANFTAAASAQRW